MPLSPTEALLEQLGPEVVCTTDDARFAASFDNMRLSFLPDAVVLPRDEEEIAAVLRMANERGVPVTPRGTGTGNTSAAAPLKGGWVLDLSNWRNLEIDAEAGLAYVQPGARTADIAAAAEAAGWSYPPDPSSHKYCTIGGNIACNAGGMHGAKYGVTRDYVLALEGFLPTGEWVRWGANLRKFSAGYNLRDLWIGSEGTLGIITGAVLRLVPKPEKRATLLFAFEDERKALRGVRKLLGKRLVPSILEFLDRQTVECTLRSGFLLPFPKKVRFAEAPSILLIELDGDRDKVKEQTAKVLELLKPASLAARQARSDKEAETLWAIRRRCSRAMFQMGDAKLNEDVVLPIQSHEALLKFTRKLKEQTGLATPTFGHAADGNYHVNIMYHRGDPVEREKAEAAVQQLMETVVQLGGAISGEHGIGLAKSSFLRIQHSQAEVDAMMAIKKAVDPNNILNPGKIFEPFAVWERNPVEVKLPWDH